MHVLKNAKKFSCIQLAKTGVIVDNLRVRSICFFFWLKVAYQVTWKSSYSSSRAYHYLSRYTNAKTQLPHTYFFHRTENVFGMLPAKWIKQYVPSTTHIGEGDMRPIFPRMFQPKPPVLYAQSIPSMVWAPTQTPFLVLECRLHLPSCSVAAQPTQRSQQILCMNHLLHWLHQWAQFQTQRYPSWLEPDLIQKILMVDQQRVPEGLLWQSSMVL